MVAENLKILIVSNNCLSTSNSNGRTIFNLVSNLKDDQVANFYVYDELPDCEGFTNFYRVRDVDALKAFTSFKKVGQRICDKKTINSSLEPAIEKKEKNTKNFKNPLGSIGREIVWKTPRWRTDEFKAWIDEFDPNVVLLQAGDAPFLFRIARKISKKRKIPLFIHNCEDYYFKKYNYMSKKHGCFYPLFRHLLKKEVKKSIKHSTVCIYNSDQLKEAYESKIKHRAITLMNSSSFDVSSKRKIEQIKKIVYLGNLGLGRLHSLIEIGQVLNEYDLKLHIYGPADQETEKNIAAHHFLKYEGLVSYERVREIILESDLVVHAESFDEYMIKDLKHALSTKISDYLSSGTPFFMYAPKGLVSTTYLYDKIPDFIATNKVDLVLKLNDIIDGDVQYPFLEIVKPLVDKNHSLTNNQIQFDKLLIDSIKEEKNREK